jgi:hypothetical protein
MGLCNIAHLDSNKERNVKQKTKYIYGLLFYKVIRLNILCNAEW